ncbi:hypothetical protein PSTG_09412 [Puccinia striiformis f. sp. tritici PST-78]|uniref:Uncharacterized protein n=1 Tax=Puccinia striiformis f. sp. tritici PST-78 TaxID=1165861 RepID=A0A0L0VDM9_9BASI|nr:hypothetical protein PSTG_09412 [Puccinia striiformis f. sp. tritici PST-78]
MERLARRFKAAIAQAMAKNLKRASNGRDPQVVTKIIGGRLSPPGDPFNAEYQEESGFCQDTVWFRRPYKVQSYSQMEMLSLLRQSYMVNLNQNFNSNLTTQVFNFFSLSAVASIKKNKKKLPLSQLPQHLWSARVYKLFDQIRATLELDPLHPHHYPLYILLWLLPFHSPLCYWSLSILNSNKQFMELRSAWDPYGYQHHLSPESSCSMKLVGEVMAIGGNFEEATQKAIWSVDPSFTGFNKNHISRLPKEYLLLPMPAPILFDRLLQN